MASLIAPDEVITAISNFEADGWTASDTVNAIVKTFEREALLLLQKPIQNDYIREQTAVVLLEASAIRDFLKEGQPEKAVIAAFNLLACGLLPENLNNTLHLANLKKRHKPFTSGGTTKKGKIYEPSASIRMICEKIESYQFDDVLDFLSDADECADIYESTSVPTGVLFCSVNDDSKTISYFKRGDNPDKVKTITFGRLGNILRDLKNNLPISS